MAIRTPLTSPTRTAPRICSNGISEIARAAPALGVRRYELGKGMEDYKLSLMSAATPLAEGSVALNPLVRNAARLHLHFGMLLALGYALDVVL